MLRRLLNNETSEYGEFREYAYININGSRIEWKVSSRMRCDILVKWLKICYGEEQTFKISECPTALDLLSRLQLKESERMKKEITEFVVASAINDLQTGAKLLVECNNYGCDDVDRLARVILTRENLTRNPEIVIDKCLMNLPIKFLDIIQGDEFKDMKNRIVLRYVKFHRDISDSEKQKTLKEVVDCCESSQEMKELYTQGIITCDKMVEYCLQKWSMTTARLNEQTLKTETVLKDLEKSKKELEEMKKKRDEAIEEMKRELSAKEEAIRERDNAKNDYEKMKSERDTAMCNLALCYQYAADKGNVDAMVSLSVCYQNGQGVAQDYKKTFELYQHAAEKGNVYAMADLGYCYQNGQGEHKIIIKHLNYINMLLIKVMLMQWLILVTFT